MTHEGLLQGAQFEMGAARLSQLPEDVRAEVAFAGRSNAGKSSAINALTGRKQLAFVSKTPGRTQQINYYRVQPGRYLVDLPGYGYARVPASVQRAWQQVLGRYLQQRLPLRALVIIMDARHPMTDLDEQMLGWFGQTGKPVRILLTKADKLSRQAQTRTLRVVTQSVEAHFANCTVQLFSSVTRLGVNEARRFILGRLFEESTAVDAAAESDSGAA